MILQGFAIPKEAQDKVVKFSFHGQPAELKHGSVVIAAITSCTNTYFIQNGLFYICQTPVNNSKKHIHLKEMQHTVPV